MKLLRSEAKSGAKTAAPLTAKTKAYSHLNIHMHTYIYIWKERHRQTDRQIGWQRQRKIRIFFKAFDFVVRQKKVVSLQVNFEEK